MFLRSLLKRSDLSRITNVTHFRRLDLSGLSRNFSFSPPKSQVTRILENLTESSVEVHSTFEEPLASASPTPTNSETLVSETEEERGGSNSKPTSFDQEDILRAIEVVERDLVAIAQCFSSLFDSLRLALSEHLMQQRKGITTSILV